MPEEKTIIGVPEDVAEKLKKGSSEEVRDILDMPGRRSEIWVEGAKESSETKKEGGGRYVSSYERKLKEIQSAASLPTSSKQTANDDDSIQFDADAIRHMEDARSRVEKLFQLAEVKGPIHAVLVAKEIDAYTLDRTHDRLADELSDRLRERGFLKESE